MTEPDELLVRADRRLRPDSKIGVLHMEGDFKLIADLEKALRAALATQPQPSAAESEFLAASIAVWREIDRLSNEPGGYHGLDAGTELRRRERTAWEAYRVEAVAGSATPTGDDDG